MSPSKPSQARSRRPPPRERLAAFCAEMELNQEEAGELFGCSQSFVSKLLCGTRMPGRKLAFSIEAKTSRSGHAIKAREWGASTPAKGSLEAAGAES